ncbi:non-ribosomal peptide synthetase [Paraflavitalea pollutisoli]|uniref:non-ribosomal peptide synthetase n=1 Tax=Paraflavitalea pollutisoli TaxID=3034143 RepID=UPI0023EB2AF5|nr:non-ribosomal peptide synthetase [Paraflavitalea sp. H1-2-19X]
MNTWEIIAALKTYRVIPRLVGDQLRLVGETASLPASLLQEVRHNKEALRNFLREALDQRAFAPIPAIPLQADYPASNAQQRIWVLSQLQGGSAAYNIVRSFYLQGAVDITCLEQAFQLAVQKHESLRTVFREREGELRQVILPDLSFTIAYTDISNDTGQHATLQAAADAAAYWHFDLTSGPLLRVKLYRLADTSLAMVFGIHHIISDGWSIAVLVPEVMRAYEMLCKGDKPVAETLSIQYKDYCQWHQLRVQGDKGLQARQFWESQFAELPPALELPADKPRPPIRTFEGAVIRFYPGKDLHGRVTGFCKAHHATAFNFFRAALSLLLSKLTGVTDITIGSPASGRNHLDLEGQIGLYVNTLPFRSTVKEALSFLAWLKQLSEHAFKVFEFQEYPFDQLVEDLQLKRDLSRNPLFDVMLAVQDAAIGEGSVNKHQQYGFQLSLLQQYLYPEGAAEAVPMAAKFDLTFNLDYEPDNRFYVEIEYDTALFTKQRIVQLFELFMHVVGQVIDNPETPLAQVVLTTPVAQQQILSVFNAPVQHIGEHHILQLLEPAFRHFPHQPALYAGETTLTYAQLQQAVDAAAARLREITSPSGHCLIGLMLERKASLVVSVLAILKAGAAYVPIEPDYPAARIQYIIEDAQLPYIIADDAGLGCVPPAYAGRVIHLHELAGDGAGLSASWPDLREHTAYVIYTSGSTGQPKGVEIRHRNTIALLKWAAREYADTRFDVLYATTSFCFDLSVFECLFPLMQGKAIRLLPTAMSIPDMLPLDQAVMLNTVPSVVRHLLQTDMDWQAVTALNVAGEPVPCWFRQAPQLAHLACRNLYGPSEDTTYSTVYRFAADRYDFVPIGVPIDNTRLYILNANRQLQPIGVPGEIWLSGQGVAKGYLNRPALTAEKFVADPFEPGRVMYATGDSGRWTPDGMVEFLGRVDDQIKIRGYRIEPGEIQAKLELHPLVQQAVVVARTVQDEQELVAYVQGDASLEASRLKAYLTGLLPAPMIPAWWVLLPVMPLNSNGKVDRKRLPEPVADNLLEPSRAEPLTSLHYQLIGLWKKVLGPVSPGATDNFFDMGGHSLKATKLRFLLMKELGREVSLNELFACPTIGQQVLLLESKPITSVEPIGKAVEQTYYPISMAQERLWVLTKFADASVAYHMPAVYRIKGVLDVQRLQRAFQGVIRRHESLRTVFVEKEGVPVQQVLPAEEIGFVVTEMPFPAYDDEQVLQWIAGQWTTLFDLGTGPLLRCAIVQGRDNHFLSFNMHHLVGDGWSLGILLQDLVAAYHSSVDAGLLSGQLSIQYKDYSVWQRSRALSSVMEQHRQFWMRLFESPAPALELPTDHNRPTIKTYRGERRTHLFAPAIESGLQQLARQCDASLFTVLLAATRVLLKKYSGQHDIVIGTPVAGREHPQLHDQIGFYVNTLPVRLEVNSADRFTDAVRREQEMLLAAWKHQAYAFETMVEELAIKRDLSRSPLFDVLVILMNPDDPGNGTQHMLEPGLYLEPIALPTGVAKYDLQFSYAQQADGLLLMLEYNADLFEASTIDRMAGHLNRLLEQLIASPELRIRDIVLPGRDEFALLTAKADQTAFAFDPTASIVSLFAQAVASYPDHIALVVGDQRWSYRALDRASSQLAGVLIREYALQPEDLVVLHFDRNEWMLIAILGVLKAGGAYVPVDPEYPLARISYIVQDADPAIILCDSDKRGQVAQVAGDRILLDITRLDDTGEGEARKVSPEQLAYVIYTSGTTGNPKGVLIEHRQVARLLHHEGNRFAFTANDRWSMFHSYCFDFSVWEMYGALLYGATLVMVPADIARDGRAFFDFLVQEQITVLNQTPTAFRSMLQVNGGELNRNVAVRYLIFGGEALLPAMLLRWHQAVPACRIVNMYGITETTVHVTYKEITHLEITENRSNIGIPMPTVSCFVLDGDLMQVPVGVIGELCVGGAGVGRGYLNKPELSATKFIAHPFQQGARMYRSGDFARILSNGDIEYIGRRDDQVKIRGHRIETAEVEHALLGQPGIGDAVVLPLKSDSGDYELASWFIATEAFEGTSQLRKSLTDLLPAYMVPSYLIELDQFPINSNGKLDKEALPRPSDIGSDELPQLPARNETDRAIVAIWESVLDRRNIGIRDNFFDLGGHSLKATRVVARIHETMGVRIDLKALFIDPTIEHLSDYIETIRWMETRHEVPAGTGDEIIF